ncbi:MAG TPA: His/Gly/Thr/Pro-type tRNA ligase C-terminal domain-containing protein, partial [Candidatus Saccharimonadales bacterium]|nr:His/Gly/Thr/Pro-type tRNA ligase C-terminal domain-containing protein [Candidatus Saccharimonadales bacterium]
GIQQPVFMGSYGIGVSRLMGLLAEHFADERGLVWPDSVAPFRVYLAVLGDEPDVRRQADELYDQLGDRGISVLYDDRDGRPGEKFADADLLGIPWRAVISQKSLQAGGAELKARTGEETKIVPLPQLADSLTKAGQA